MRFPRVLVALPVALTLGLTLGGPVAVADPPAPPGSKASPSGKAHRAERAENALAAVEALIDGRAARSDDPADGRSFTMALHELRLVADALPAADRARARQILQRPGDPGDGHIPVDLPLSRCSADICVHYTESGNHAPTGSDGDPATVPAYIEQVRDTVQRIHDDYIAAGYRPEKGDGTIGGGSDDTDIYIGDIGAAGLYGYCTSDDPHDPLDPDDAGYGDFSAWAYCTLDDDYAQAQFPDNTPIQNMRVTAAHEYFHATQYAYDAWEDGWILESTATWVEDEMFDAVNDNRQYLANSPITAPRTPIDHFGDGFHYGTWIWWRFLTEKFPTKTGKLPDLVREVWERLDGAPGGPDDYSTQGLSRILRSEHGTSFKRELQLFFAANRHPRRAYAEGSSYPVTRPGLKFRFSRAQKKAAFCKPRHMSACIVQSRPKDLKQRDWKLRLKFDAPRRARGGAFVVVVYKRSGDIATSVVRLSRTGAGRKTVPFSSRRINRVDVLFVNTSARFDCWVDQYSPYSCLGIPKDDRLRSEFVARAFRS